MVNAQQAAKLQVAVILKEAREKILECRSSIVWDPVDVNTIHRLVEQIDDLFTKVIPR